MKQPTQEQIQNMTEHEYIQWNESPERQSKLLGVSLKTYKRALQLLYPRGRDSHEALLNTILTLMRIESDKKLIKAIKTITNSPKK